MCIFLSVCLSVRVFVGPVVLLGSARFAHWFPYKPEGRAGVRKNETFKEEHARTNRLKDSPIFYMRRRLNGKEGKT